MKKVILLTLISFLHISANEKTVNLQNIEIKSATELKKRYEKEENLLIEPNYEDNSSNLSKKDEKLSLDGAVDVNKKEKSIDGGKVNIGVKF